MNTAFTKHKSFDYLLILLVLLLGLWPLTFSYASMKWDMPDIYLPWKNYITECLHNGVLPLWNPFMNNGFIQAGDPGTWYPVSWLVGLLRPYDLTSAHLEFLLHLYIGGIGFYKVGSLFSMSRAARISTAVSYMFCGFFISNAQHMGWIVSGAWFPWVFYYFLSLKNTPSFLSSCKLALAAFLMLSGGYPGFFITTAYLLIAYFLFNTLQNRNWILIKSWLWYYGIAAVLFLSASAVVLYHTLQLSAHMERSNGLPFDNSSWGILSGSLTLPALWSFLFPYSTSINDPSVWQTDFSLINCYFGFIALLLLVFMLVFQKSFHRKEWVLIGCLFLCTALANEFPLRFWLYKTLPYMNVFRFSTLFRLFSIFFFLLFVGVSIDKLSTSAKLERYFLYVMYATIGLLQVFAVYLLSRVNVSTFKWLIYQKGFVLFDKNAGIPEKLFFNVLILIGMLGLASWFIRKKILPVPQALGLFMVLDLLIAVQLNSFATVVVHVDPRPVDKAIGEMPRNYPFPKLDIPYTAASDKSLGGSIPYIWRNFAVYHKVPSFDGYSPYSFYTAEKTYPSEIIDQPFLFLSGKPLTENRIDTTSIDKASYKKISWVNFNPNEVHVSVKLDEPQTLTLLQYAYPYWNAYIDSSPAPLLKTNGLFMSVALPTGQHDVRLVCESKTGYFLFLLSAISFVGMGVVVAGNRLLLLRKR